MNGCINELEESNIAKGIAITEDYVTEKQLEELAERLPNQPVLYRHVHPASPGRGEVFGRVIEAEIVEHEGKKKLAFTAKLADHNEVQRKLIEYIREKAKVGDPVGVSLGFVAYNDDVYPYDLSITRIPVVEESGIVMEMEDTEKIKKLEEALDLIKKKDEELKKILLEKQKVEEDLRAVKVELEKAKSIASAKEEELKKAVEARISELENTYKARIEKLEKAPIIEKIYELEKDSWHRDHTYPSMSLEQLKERYNILLERKKATSEAAAKIVVQEKPPNESEMDKAKLINKIVMGAVNDTIGGVKK